MVIPNFIRGDFGSLFFLPYKYKGTIKYTHAHTEKSMNNTQPKSGFEIRAELLSQAQSLLEGNLYRSNDAVVQHNDSFPNDKKPWGGQFISTEDVISTARKLNEFVNER